MQRVYEFIKNAGTYYIATVDGDQARVRPFGTIHIFEDKLYIQTGKSKACSKQMAENPKIEICAMKDGSWIRLSGTAVDDPRVEAKESMLEAYPNLKAMYDANDPNTQVLYIKDAKAVISSFTAAPIEIEF